MQVDIREILQIARNALSVLAPLTATEWDDRILKILNAIAADETLLDWLDGLTHTFDPPTMSLSATSVPTAVLSAAASRGLQWSDILKYLPAIIELIRSLRGGR